MAVAAVMLRALDNALRRVLGITPPWTDAPASTQAYQLAGAMSRALAAKMSGHEGASGEVVEAIELAIEDLANVLGVRFAPRSHTPDPWSELRAEITQLGDALDRLEQEQAAAPSKVVSIGLGEHVLRLRLVGPAWEIDDTDRLAIRAALADRSKLSEALHRCVVIAQAPREFVAGEGPMPTGPLPEGVEPVDAVTAVFRLAQQLVDDDNVVEMHAREGAVHA